jgi:hypothetical protein
LQLQLIAVRFQSQPAHSREQLSRNGSELRMSCLIIDRRSSTSWRCNLYQSSLFLSLKRVVLTLRVRTAAPENTHRRGHSKKVSNVATTAPNIKGVELPIELFCFAWFTVEVLGTETEFGVIVWVRTFSDKTWRLEDPVCCPFAVELSSL